jgi:hypothetical protein
MKDTIFNQILLENNEDIKVNLLDKILKLVQEIYDKFSNISMAIMPSFENIDLNPKISFPKGLKESAFIHQQYLDLNNRIGNLTKTINRFRAVKKPIQNVEGATRLIGIIMGYVEPTNTFLEPMVLN